jgi:hypothetical protein
MAPPTLLTLPYDIKVEILKELLCSSQVIKTHATQGSRASDDPTLHIAILKTCKAFHDDGAYMLYHFNKFYADLLPGPRSKWIETIGQCNLAYVKSLSILIILIRGSGGFLSIGGFPSIGAEVRYPKHCRDTLIALMALSRGASRLRNVSIELFGAIDDRPDPLIEQFQLLKAVVSMRNLQMIRLEGNVPRLWVLYLNRRARVPLQLCQYANIYILNLTSSISKLRASISETEDIIEALARETPPSNASTSESDEKSDERKGDDEKLFEDFDGFNAALELEEPSFNGPRRYFGLNRDYVFDEPEKHATSNKEPISEADPRGPDLFAAEVELYSGKFWPPINFHKEQLRIEEAKLEMLLEFVEELKELGILKKKERVPTTSTPDTVVMG